MYLYENYWRPDACPDHDQLTRKLSSVGFESDEIQEALTWLDGVATAARDVVRDGVVRGYFLGSYSARKLGLASTGNAGGAHNLVVSSGADDLAAMLRRMGRGLFVTEQLGRGVNPVTGDYSRGAAGYWVENGVIVHPVEEITIAGNLRDMFRGIVAIGSDVDRRGSTHVGSLLVDRMTIAGQ